MKFNRIISLIGEKNFDKIQNKKILIVGVGGVGGFILESLVRSGIKYIDIIDYDKIDETNINRQIITNINNIKEYKVDAAKKRALEINEEIIINCYKEYLNKDNINKILTNKYDYIVDACDDINTKLELMKLKNIYKYKLISSMGTAKKIDPTKLQIMDLTKTNYDPLAKKLRRLVKENNIRGKQIVVSSNEEPINCDILGSFIFVPAASGILCAKYVINDIINN